MNISQLECFVSLASTLNFVKTADQLGLTQPAVTKQLKAIESELGTKLFQRTSRSVVLTPVGEQFLSEASEMLNIYYRTKTWIGAYSGNTRNPIRIGYTDPMVMPHISNILRQFSNLNPCSVITPELVFDQTDANLGKLKKEQIDCLFAMRDALFDDTEIIFSPLMTCGFICAVAKSHPLARPYLDEPDRAKEVTTEQFWEYRQIIATPPYLMKRYFSNGKHVVPINDKADNILCSNTNEAYALVLAGLGYSMIPEYLKMNYPDILYLKWVESRHAPFGVYYKEAKSSMVSFIRVAKSYFAATLQSCGQL